MAKGEKKKATVPPTTNLTSGAMAYNRLDLQISQAVLLTIELFNQSNFLILMDYYDDIVVFSDEVKKADVTFYQVKTKDNNSMTMSTILAEEWLPKLYSHLRNPEFIVKELAFVTNVPITYRLSDGSDKRLENPKTNLLEVESEIQCKIKQKIADAHGISSADVDLAKFCHIKTTLTISEHTDIAEKKFSDFLFDSNNQIDVKSVKTIFKALREMLERVQKKELKDEPNFDEVIKHKGFKKSSLDRIITETLTINLPPFEVIWCIIGGTDEEMRDYTLGYSKLCELNLRSGTVYRALVEEIQEIAKQLNQPTFQERLKACLVKLTESPKIAFSHIVDKYPDIILAAIEINKEGVAE